MVGGQSDFFGRFGSSLVARFMRSSFLFNSKFLQKVRAGSIPAGITS